MAKKTYQTRSLGKRIWRARQLYLLLAIPFIWLIVFHYVPMAGVQIAFKNYTIKGGIWGSEWVGFKQFQKLFSDYNFKRILINTLRLSLYTTVVSSIMPVILALALNCLRKNKLKKAVQTITYMPHFISVVVMVGMLNQLLNPLIGLYGNVWMELTGNRAPDILGVPSAFLHLYVWSGIWHNVGYNSVIYIAALTNADQELHEAAQIDGATRLQRVRHIDFPCIIPTIIINLILRMGSIMSVGFEKVFLLQNSLNLKTSEIVSTYVYQVGLSASGTSDFSYATAIGCFNSVVNLILICSVNKIARKHSETSLW